MVGGGATSPTVDLGGGSFNNRLADFVFFDIDGAVAGDSFSVSVTGGRQGCACLGGVSFDAIAAVPEPASWALMIGGVGAVGGALRRRAKVAARVRFV